ncbi:hypothetical protein SELMODRAFT_270024 [Selaginella moellendorffii]|uniref:Peptidase C1A papain C-terminal domain-containing protein n=1 Tax=Selaginella moellendorffii TaxID=88036 RepID=D8TC83_SELML|nr:cathepsin B-like protease 3 [Selaginella moellendorffii]EFJ05715.1 hypothetical protein SELMODRAFT_270024 [Selaginella moellendorffii]|eukprot:XP_002993195.1 cathepsin B-like protease 3 [Selaginella moellendorffii]
MESSLVLAAAAIALLFSAVAQGVRVAESGKLDLGRPLLQKSIVDIVNNDPNAGWKAGFNERFINHTVRDFKRLCGVLPKSSEEVQPLRPLRSHPRTLDLPKHFDAREAWPQCSSIKNILDQGHCGSCWAFGAVEALTDRFCILNNENVSLSENDLVACCSSCGFGCDGGYPYAAWEYFAQTGVVTSQCDPYFDGKGCKHPGCEPEYDTPVCVKQCVDNEQWRDSKHFTVQTYAVNSDIYDIQAEIYKNGPVEVSYTVYEDFAHYKSGVYKHVFGEVLGGHAVKFIGWGTTDDGKDYWIVANSWNRSWGEDGFFQISRGSNECGIESEPVAGIPLKKTGFSDI